MLAFSNDYYGMIFRATQSVELFCAYDNQELAKGIAFIKSRRAELNVVQMVENMRDQAIPNGVIINE